MIGAGIFSLCSFAAVPPCGRALPSGVSVGLSAVLFGYQLLIVCAVKHGGAIMQALINCNVCLIALHRHIFAEPAERPAMLVAATGAAALTAAVLAAGRF